MYHVDSGGGFIETTLSYLKTRLITFSQPCTATKYIKIYLKRVSKELHVWLNRSFKMSKITTSIFSQTILVPSDSA